jgi:hypothetical protein
MDAKPLAFFVCEKILRDIMNPNKLSFIGVFSGFTTRALPFVCPPMFIAIQYGLGQGECNHHFEIQHSSGQILFKSPIHSFFLDNRTVSHTDIAGVEGIFFPHPGQYWVKSYLEGELMAEVPLNITYQPPDFTRTGDEEHE